MERISTPTAEPDLHGTGKPGFRDGAGFPAVEPTDMNAAWFNAVQEEIARTVEGAGIALDSGSYTQLFAAHRTFLRTFPVMASLTPRLTDSSHNADALLDVCFIPAGGPLGLGVFAAVGLAGIDDLTPVFSAALWLSYDGSFWTKTVYSALGFLKCVATGNGVIVACGETDAHHPLITTAPIDLSTPLAAVDISSLAIATSSNPIYDVCWDGVHSRFVAVGARSGPGTALLYGNATGTAWTMVSPANSYLGDFYRALQIGARTIAFGSLGVIQTSDDGGSTWTERHNDSSLGTIDSSAAITGVILANTGQERTMLRSTDNGATWAEIYSPLALSVLGIDDAVIEHVGSFDRMLFAVCKDATSERRYIIASMDGAVTWPYVARMPAVDTTGAAAAAIHATATDTTRLVAVGEVVSLVSAVAFSSSAAALGEF